MRNLMVCGLLLSAMGWAQQYGKDGALVLPRDYREWVFLSSGLGMTYNASAAPNGNPPFENVFVNPAAYRTFLKTGMWPDKTVMILEVRASGSQASINKDGRIQTGVVAREAHVKDRARGGWAFYGFANGAESGTLFPKTADCYSCHQRNGAVDTTFVQFYPTLIETARRKGTYRETERAGASR